MAIIIYQVIIALIILISALFGRNSRNNVIKILIIWTLLHVFALWLAIIQFITILIAYMVTEKYIEEKESPYKKNEYRGRF